MVKRKKQEFLFKLLIFIAVLIGAILLLIPLAWLVSTSLKPRGQLFLTPPKWIPNPILWGNYKKALTILPFHIFLKNTLIITFSVTFGTVLSSSIVAFGFARLRAPLRNFFFIVLLSTLMIPFQVVMIPRFILFKYLGWIDTFAPIIVPNFFAGAWNTFLLRQFYLTIPLEYDDAARIDGCSSWGIYWRIILPLAKPALVAIGIYSIMWQWNDFLEPLIYLNSQRKFTLQLGLRIFQGMHFTDWSLMMAATTVVLLPCLVLFFFTQRYFMKGIVVSGVKG